jgi:hypothetical protein
MDPVPADAKKYKLVYEFQTKKQQLRWKEVFDACVAAIERLMEEEE